MGYSIVAGLFFLLMGIGAGQVYRGLQNWRQGRLPAPARAPAIDHDGPVNEQGAVRLLGEALQGIDDPALVDRLEDFSIAEMDWRDITCNLPTLDRTRGEQMIDLMMASCRRMVEQPGLIKSPQARRQMQASLERVIRLLRAHEEGSHSKAIDDFIAELRAVDRRAPDAQA